jgi:hypothetical protein
MRNARGPRAVTASTIWRSQAPPAPLINTIEDSPSLNAGDAVSVAQAA